MQWNAQGITTITTITELQNFIDKHQIDIVFLCETLLKPKHKFYLNNYTTYRSDRAEHGGGVAICINKNIKHKILPAYKTNYIENVSIAVNIDNREIVMTSAYSPKYLQTFRNDINKLTPIHREFIVLGDLNAKNLAWNCTTNNTAGNILVNIQNHRNFYVHHSNTPTHFPHCGSTPSTLDILLSNSTCHFSPLIAHSNELPSDHAPVVTTFDADIETKDSAKMFHYQASWRTIPRIVLYAISCV